MTFKETLFCVKVMLEYSKLSLYKNGEPLTFCDFYSHWVVYHEDRSLAWYKSVNHSFDFDVPLDF